MLQRRTPLKAKTSLKSKMGLKRKSKAKKAKDRQYQEVCALVDRRDEHQCQHPGCEETEIEHHHIKFRSQGGKDHVENLVSLCWQHHKGDIGPHESREWRKYWEQWQIDHYPEFVKRLKEQGKIGVINSL